jgi:hypothetical protein
MGLASANAALVMGQAPPKRKIATNRRWSDDFIALWRAPKCYSQKDLAKDANPFAPFKPICYEMENRYFVKETPLTIYRPAPGAVTGQKTLPRQQHQRPGEEQQIEQVLRLIRHLQHDQRIG